MHTHTLKTQGWRYAAPARLLHWLMAVLIPAMLALGWTMMEVEDEPGSEVYFNLHKSLGLLLLLLLLAARAAWRLGHRPASLPPSVAPWQARLSRLDPGRPDRPARPCRPQASAAGQGWRLPAHAVDGWRAVPMPPMTVCPVCAAQ